MLPRLRLLPLLLVVLVLLLLLASASSSLPLLLLLLPPLLLLLLEFALTSTNTFLSLVERFRDVVPGSASTFVTKVVAKDDADVEATPLEWLTPLESFWGLGRLEEPLPEGPLPLVVGGGDDSGLLLDMNRLIRSLEYSSKLPESDRSDASDMASKRC